MNTMKILFLDSLYHARRNLKVPSSWLFILLLVLSIFCVHGLGARGRDQENLDNSWDFSLCLDSEGSDKSLGSKSELSLSFTIGEVKFDSISEFRSNWSEEDSSFAGGFYRQSFLTVAELRGWQFDSETVFLPYLERLDYMLAELDSAYGNLSVKSKFLIEYVKEEKAFGSGWELILEGSLSGVGKASLATRFGMDKYLREIHDPTVSGSGYYIITGDDGKLGPSAYPYGSTLITLRSVKFGCFRFSNRTKFMRGEGFLFSGFSFRAEADNFPLELTSYLYFTSQTTSFSIVPSLSVDWGNWEIVFDLGGVWDSSSGYKLNGIGVGGIRLDTDEISGLKLSGSVSLEGGLWKKKGSRVMRSHASDYRVLGPIDEIVREYTYIETPYEGITTLEITRPLSTGGSISFYLDTYSCVKKENGFFGISLYTGEFVYRPNERFEVLFALKGEPIDGVQRMEGSVKYSF